MTKRTGKKKTALTETPARAAYAVGYVKPPKATQFLVFFAAQDVGAAAAIPVNLFHPGLDRLGAGLGLA